MIMSETTQTFRWLERLTLYERLMRLDKPIGILLLLWPTLWGLWIAAEGEPSWVIVWIFTLGVVLMRSAGCVINDFADRNIDPFVERTKERPLAARRVSVKEALTLFFVLTLLAFLLILPILTPLLFWLAVVAFLLAASYPFTKRFLSIPQAYLGVAFGFGVPMAFAAIRGEVPSLAWWMLAANVFWAIAYDTEYALVDIEDDRKIGIKTSALTFGRFVIPLIMLCYFFALAILAFVGWQAQLGWPYALGLLGAAAISAYHYRLIRTREREKCFRAFLHNNWFGAAIFAGLALDYLLRQSA
ncbi:MAG: 4-hydroxybenzoate octaprenyltransferase [Rhodocyclaceae bacterium]|nr:4-hydroxybenzoate octaprenyltransferase [Rhodocyclaceae bacterium]